MAKIFIDAVADAGAKDELDRKPVHYTKFNETTKGSDG